MSIKNAHWGLGNYKLEEVEERESRESTKSVTIVAAIEPQILGQTNSSLTKAPVN